MGILDGKGTGQRTAILGRDKKEEEARKDIAKSSLPNLQQLNTNLTSRLTEVKPVVKPVEPQRNARQQWVDDRIQQDRDATANNKFMSTINRLLEPASRVVYGATSYSPISSFQKGAAQAMGITPESIGAAPTTGGIGDIAGNIVGQVAGTFANPGNAFKGVGTATLETGRGVAQAVATKAPILSNRFAQSAIEGAATGALEGAYATALQRGDTKDLAMNVGLGIGLGAAADIALTGIGDVASSVLKRSKGNTPNVNQTMETPTTINNNVAKKIEQVETPTQADEVAASSPEVTPEYKQSWWEKLFGNQGVGIAAGRGTNKNLIDEHIVDRQVKRGPLIEKVKTNVAEAEQNFIDMFAPFKDISPQTYAKAMDTTRANNLATLAVKRNMVDLEGNVIGESLANVYSTVPRGQKHLADRYLILRNSVNRMERDKAVWGKEAWFPQTADEASVMVQEMQQRHPWIMEFGNKWDGYVRNLQDMYVQYGIAPDSLVKTLREMYPHYAPTMRQVDETKRLKGRIGGSKQSMSNQGANIKKATGGTGKIVDPAQSMIDNVSRTYNAALRNRVMQDIYQSVIDNPSAYEGIIEIVPQSQKIRSEMLEEVNKRLANDDLDGLTDFINERFEQAKLASSDAASKKGQAKVVALINGEPVEMIIKDASLLKAIEGVSPTQVKGVMKIIDSVSRAIKHSATGVLAPLQGAKLAIRDLPIAFFQAKDKANFIAKDLPMAMISQLADWLPDFVPVPDSLTRLARQYYNAGGGYEAFLRGDSRVRAASKELVKDPVLSSRNITKTMTRTLLSPFHASKEIGDAFENIPRIAAFNNQMRLNGWKTDEASIRKALEEAREITVNWSRKGSKGQDLEALLPYSNAAVQGSYRFFKRLKEQPVSAIALLTTIAGAKIASYEMFKDDRDYQNRSPYEKGIPIGKTKEGKFITIPVEPTEAFVADQLLDFYKFAIRQDKRNLKTTTKERLQQGADAFLPTYASGPLAAFTQEGKAIDVPAAFNAVTSGSAIEPVSAMVSGQNFYGGNIVPYDHQELPTSLQHNETTSVAGKWAAENLGISGFMFDYLATKLGGDFAKVGLPMTSEVGQADPVGNVMAETATRLKLLEDPVMKNRISNDYFNLATKVKEAKAAEMKNVELPEWYQDAYDAVTSTKKGTVASDISDLNKQKKNIQLDVSLSAKERADKLREIQTQINLLRLEGIEILTKLGVE